MFKRIATMAAIVSVAVTGASVAEASITYTLYLTEEVRDTAAVTINCRNTEQTVLEDKSRSEYSTVDMASSYRARIQGVLDGGGRVWLEFGTSSNALAVGRTNACWTTLTSVSDSEGVVARQTSAHCEHESSAEYVLLEPTHVVELTGMSVNVDSLRVVSGSSVGVRCDGHSQYDQATVSSYILDSGVRIHWEEGT